MGFVVEGVELFAGFKVFHEGFETGDGGNFLAGGRRRGGCEGKETIEDRFSALRR